VYPPVIRWLFAIRVVAVVGFFAPTVATGPLGV
jgi:hypothetical protein